LVKQILEDVAKVSDFADKVKAFFGSLTLLVAGYGIYTNFQDIGDEIPYRKEVGIGFMVFGGVFFLALVTGGAVQARLKSLLLALVAVIFAGGAAWFLYPKARDAYELAQRGEVVTATVAWAAPPWTKTGTYKTIVRWGDGGATLKLKTHRRKGATMRVRILRDRPKAAVVADAGETTWAILTSHAGTAGTLAFIVIGLFAAISIPFCLWSFLCGPPRAPPADAG